MQGVKTVAIVSLSSGVLGEDFVQHEVKIGLERLRRFGVEVKFMENALKGLDYQRASGEEGRGFLTGLFRQFNRYDFMCHRGRGYLSPTSLSF